MPVREKEVNMGNKGERVIYRYKSGKLYGIVLYNLAVPAEDVEKIKNDRREIREKVEK